MGSESLSNSDLAAWMQSEHETLVALNKVIREHIAARPEANIGNWLAGLRVAYGRLIAHLERNFRAQEADGYLKFIVEHRPTLSRQVEQIRCEHPELLRMADRIRVDLAEATPEQRLLVADVTARIQRFMAVVAQHDQRENMLALFASNQDIGVGD